MSQKFDLQTAVTVFFSWIRAGEDQTEISAYDYSTRFLWVTVETFVLVQHLTERLSPLISR